jgi:hypothetical protein
MPVCKYVCVNVYAFVKFLKKIKTLIFFLNSKKKTKFSKKISFLDPQHVISSLNFDR